MGRVVTYPGSFRRGVCADDARPAPRDVRLEARLRQDPIFMPRLRDAVPDARAVAEARSCWFGVGLRGRRLSQALPLDVLQLVFAQETVRRALGLPRSYILIADSNARAVGDEPRLVHVARARVQRMLAAVCEQFRFPVSIFFASQLCDHAPLDTAASGGDNPYVELQLAQMEHMRRRGSAVKIGWALAGCDEDERRFDELYRRRFRQPLGFVYTHGGRSLWRDNPRCCPYVCERPSHRLLLDPGEVIAVKLARHRDRDPELVRAYRRLLGRLARAHRTLVDPHAGGDPVQRLQGVLDRLPRPS